MASSISAGTTSSTALVATADTSGALVLQTNNGTTALTLSTAQVVTFAGTAILPTTLGVGNATPAASGAGITFPATQSASSDANTLDDYEEGTWTPTVTFNSGSATVASAAAYIKIGKTCFVNGYISFSSVSAATAASITNFPFTAVSLSGTPRQVFVAREDAATGKMGQFFISAGTTTAGLQDYLGANGVTVIADGYKWVFSGTYNTSA